MERRNSWARSPSRHVTPRHITSKPKASLEAGGARRSLLVPGLHGDDRSSLTITPISFRPCAQLVRDADIVRVAGGAAVHCTEGETRDPRFAAGHVQCRYGHR